MEIKIEQTALCRIWEQLNAPHRAGLRGTPRTAHRDVVRDGWGTSVDIQDILWETDDRADLLARHHDDFDPLRRAYRLDYTSRYRGPFTRAQEVYGHEAMRADEIAMFVMEVERLGFTVDAEPLVHALRPGLLRRKYLTNSELSVVWYHKQRHRCASIVLRVDGATPTESTTIETHSGYKATAVLREATPVALRVEAPRSKQDIPTDYWIYGELRRSRQHA